MRKLKIFIAGHRGMVGSALVRMLKEEKQYELILKSRNELDLINQYSVNKFFEKQKLDQVYLLAAKVGGILANNTFPADFIYENLMIEANVINAAFKNGVKKLLFLGSSCIYPKFSNQPINENYLMTGPLECTNEPYAVAKIAGIKLCESYNRQFGSRYGIDYRSIMPTNLYGPGDNYHPKNSHVIPALIQRFHSAKVKKKNSVTVWGNGIARREFLYVDDLAKACIFLMNLKKKIYLKKTSLMCSHVNVGSGKDQSIRDLAGIIKKVVGYRGEIKFDNKKLEGTPKKLLNSSLINRLGWKSKVNLREGITLAYKDFLNKLND